MIKNYILDADLKKFYPLISNTLWSTQADYSTQISKAFDIMINDLWNRGLNPRQCMIPLDLNRADGADANQPLTALTKTATFTGEAYEGENQRRFAVKPSVCTGTFTFQLQGSNEVSEPASGDSSWEDAGSTLSFASTTAEQSLVLTTQYRWYRYKITIAATTCTYTACLYETIFDDLISHRALAMIFNDWSQASPDYIRFAETEMALYDSGLSAVKFYYDSDDDGVAETTDPLQTSNIRFTR
jgi:hypothetical protein